tara:strand:- start:120 stop:287 length:168 start_codon:yes stop_codon:yes gene_type:complete
MEKHSKVNLRISDIKNIIGVYELIKFENLGPLEKEEKETLNRIIRQCKKAMKNEN